MNLDFTDIGWEHFLYWIGADKKKLKKILDIIKDIKRHPSSGIGKPEQLKENWSGWWARRIDEKNRIVYRVVDDKLEITQCKGHYEDK
jgi:toxin YoeB